MFAGVLRSFCSECFYLFTKGVVRRMLLCVVPGNHSCQRLATAERWQMGVVFQDRCLCCSLGVPEWKHYTIYYYTTIFSYISSGWSSSPDIILLQLLIVASKGTESSHKAARLGKVPSSISIKQSLKTWRACLLLTIKLLDVSAQICHVVDWFSCTDQSISACVRWTSDLPIEEETDTNQPAFDWAFWNVKLKQPHLSLRHCDWHVLWLIVSASSWTFNHRNIIKGQSFITIQSWILMEPRVQATTSRSVSPEVWI